MTEPIGNGWQEYAITNNNATGQFLPIHYATATFTVPLKPVWEFGNPGPSPYGDNVVDPGKQIPLIFPALMDQYHTEILQPVLQYNAWIGEWTIYCEAIYTVGGMQHYSFSDVQIVYPGQELTAIMGDATGQYHASFVGGPSLDVQMEHPLTEFTVALEQFGTWSPNFFPGSVHFHNIGLIVGDHWVNPTPADMTEIVNFDGAGQDVDIVGTPYGTDITLHTWWNG